MLLWVIWIHRNNKFWNQQLVPPLQSVKNCLIWLEDYQRDNYGSKGRLEVEVRNDLGRWQPPILGQLKINFDIATSEQFGRVGFRAVCRDHEGRTLACWSRSASGRWSALVAESMGLKLVLQWLLAEGWSNVLIESHTQGVVHRLNNNEVDLSDVGGILDSCLQLLRSCFSLRVHYVKRYANAVADGLAKVSFNWSQPMY
ncbi:hypothetical protein M5689_021741 [Euphorbia peplus]|nr:hypothetical protein M5689_021741 [Euphorbia peplus]